ncbi:hypothetical protein QUA24_26095 [Microcoleus sp. Pol12B5]
MSDTKNHDLHFNSENRTNKLADGELDERDLEVISGGCPPPPPPSPLDIFQAKLKKDIGFNAYKASYALISRL